MLKISKTYEVITNESAEQGEAAESGFVFEDQPCGFRELLDTIKADGFAYPDSSHGIPRWLSTEPQQDYRTGAWVTYSLHTSHDARSMRYWNKAMKVLGYSE